MERKTRSYLQLVKPGITLSNSLSAVAGYFLAASSQGFGWKAFLGVVAGIALVVASACVANNILDRNLDKRMKRTAKREVASGAIDVPRALAFSVALSVAGFALLAVLTNALTVWLGVMAFVWYVAIYGYAKRTTPFSTIIGTVCGALPPVAGYTAVTNSLDMAAFILFVLLVLWQLPHFYAIAIFRRDDYKNAKLPVWTVYYGVKSTKMQMLVFVVVFALAAPLLTVYGYAGYTFLFVMSALAAYWVIKSLRGFRRDKADAWARQVFGASLVVLIIMCAALASGGYLP